MDDAQVDPFVARVGAAIAAGRLIEPRAGVVVGVSGGADSVALLSALRELSGAEGGGYRLIVAHLHHGLRDEADAEEQFVAELARRWGLPLETRRCDVRAEAHERREGVEQAGRRARYEFLLDVARRCRAGCVAVGHHADDQVETVLFHVIRGCHLRGAAGMGARRELGEGVALVRPMLGLRRADVEGYCARGGLEWCRDASNSDPAFRRNIIRAELLPLLRRLNPQVEEAILGLAAAAGEAEEHLGQLGAAALAAAASAGGTIEGTSAVLELAVLTREAPVIRRYVVRAALEQAGVPMRGVTAGHLHELAAMAGGEGAGAVDLPGGWSVRREDGRLVVSHTGAGGIEGKASWAAVRLAYPGRTELPDGRAVACEVGAMDRRGFEEHCRSGRHDVEWLDADTIEGVLECRPRREGDVFRPLGCRGRRKVGKLLGDVKLPTSARRTVLCVSDQAGIVACLPVRVDERVKVTEVTRRVLRIGVLDADEAGR